MTQMISVTAVSTMTLNQVLYILERDNMIRLSEDFSRDSLAGKNKNPLSLNLYTYCHNNPTIYQDNLLRIN